VRAELQALALRDGVLFQHLGALLLELGRATLTLTVGTTPVCVMIVEILICNCYFEEKNHFHVLHRLRLLSMRVLLFLFLQGAQIL
jgi:hypothetical protein